MTKKEERNCGGGQVEKFDRKTMCLVFQKRRGEVSPLKCPGNRRKRTRNWKKRAREGRGGTPSSSPPIKVEKKKEKNSSKKPQLKAESWSKKFSKKNIRKGNKGGPPGNGAGCGKSEEGTARPFWEKEKEIQKSEGGGKGGGDIFFNYAKTSGGLWSKKCAINPIALKKPKHGRMNSKREK